jgi:S1-C subfamily serine protease
MKSLRIAFAAAALAALCLTSRLPAEELSGADLYEKCVKSTVFIVTPLKGGHAEGSGSLIDAERRLVITNYHVVDENEMVFVQFPVRLKDGSLMTDKKKYIERIPAGQALKGKVLFRDKTRDLALVQLDRLPPDTRALPLAKKSPRVGEFVINIGNPGKVNQTFSTTDGKVRAVGIEDMVVHGDSEVLRIKAKMVTVTNPINPGDSGGPIIDKRGYQVAVTESGYSGAAAQNVNSCVDVSEVRAFLAEKKVTIKELSDEPDAAVVRPKAGPGAIVPKKDSLTTTPKIDSAPGTAPPDKKADPVPAPAGPTAEDEKAAARELSRANLFANSDDDRPTYISKLKEVVAKYPGTAAAKDAKKKLDALK